MSVVMSLPQLSECESERCQAWGEDSKVFEKERKPTAETQSMNGTGLIRDLLASWFGQSDISQIIQFLFLLLRAEDISIQK